jgi:hypothetical protein
MTDTAGSGTPFFPQGDMMEKMWEMMRINPFAAASPSLSTMSDMLAPLTNVEELDKRITDMRAVEQWLKLNLNMLQSAIQALEVQRATLATLRAFGAYAQSSGGAGASGTSGTSGASAGTGGHEASAWAWPLSTEQPKAQAREPDKEERKQGEKPEEAGAKDASFDPSGWWNMLQSQFNNLASIAMTQASAAAEAVPAAKTPVAPAAPKKAAARKAPARKAPATKAPVRKKTV